MKQEIIDEIKNFFTKKIKKAVLIIVVIVASIVFAVALIYNIFDKIVNAFSDTLDGIINDVTIADDGSIQLPEDYEERLQKALDEIGMSKADLEMGDDLSLLTEFLEAQLVTSYPYTGGEGLQGVATITRSNPNGEIKTLEFKNLDAFNKMIENGNQDANNYFSIEKDNVVISKTTIVTDSEGNSETKFEKDTFNYRTMLDPYAMPFEFPLILQLITKNQGYTQAVVDLVKSSAIEISILESTITTTTTEEIEYISRKWTSSGTLVNGNLTNATEQVPSDTPGQKEEPKVTTETSTISTVALVYAKTWLLQRTLDVTYRDETTTEVVEQELKDEIGEVQIIPISAPATNPDSNNTTQSCIIVREDKVDRTKTITIEMHFREWVTGAEELELNLEDFIGLIKNEEGGAYDQDSSGLGDSAAQATGTAKDILESAEKIHTYMEENKYSYSLDTQKLATTFEKSKKHKVTCCATFVSWVLIDAGLLDECVHSAPGLSSKLQQSKYGFKKVSANSLKAGDVMCYSGHIEIYAGDKTIYNAGSTSAIQRDNPYGQWSTPSYGLRPPDTAEFKNNSDGEGADENATSETGGIVYYKVPNKTNAYKAPYFELESTAYMMFELLSRNEKTQSHEQIMRYVMYKVTGKNYGVTELKIEDVFSDGSLTGVTGNVGEEYLKSWEHNALRKYMNGSASYNDYLSNYVTEDKKYYICYTDNGRTKNYGFGVCHWIPGWNHVNRYSELGKDIKADKYNTIGSSKMEVEIVDQVKSQIYNDYRSSVESATQSLGLEEYQIDALTAVKYQYGNIGNFVEAYKQCGNKEELKSAFVVNGYNPFIRGPESNGRANANWTLFHKGIYTTPDGEKLDPASFVGATGKGSAVIGGVTIVAPIEWTADEITSWSGYRIHPISGEYKHHNGIDIGKSEGTPIVAAADGKVTLAGWNGGYGNCVIIDHGEGVTTLYAHASSLNVSAGDQVKKGQIVAKVGTTGNSTGPHLHFEIKLNGEGQYDKLNAMFGGK